MSGGWSKYKNLVAAVAVIIILNGVIVWKEMGESSAPTVLSVSKPSDNTTSHNTTYHVLSTKTATTPPISPVDDHDNSHGVGTNNSDTSELVAQQIQNYKDGKGIILNIHITHHAGTALCGRVGRAPGTRGAPSFACMGVKPQDNVTIDFPRRPWKNSDTAKNIELVRPFFHLISWEFGPPQPLKDTDWENPNLVSVIVMRDPISRLLAGDGGVNKKYPGMRDGGNGTKNENMWWQYATTDLGTNNYALSKLATGCCQHNQTDPKHLEEAKQLVSRFTFVLDIRCLDKGMEAMANILGVKQLREVRKRPKKDAHISISNSDRIGHKEVYDYLLDSNKLDIQLYEWSKNISLVRCDD